jgi:hypothetical protein
MERTRTAAAVTAAAEGYDFNDTHFHLTNYIQEGIDHSRLPADHGHARRPVHALRHSPAADVGYQKSGDFRADVLPADDAPLYYYSFTDAYIASVYRSLRPSCRRGSTR